MSNITSSQNEKEITTNVVFIEFYNKKHFPPGVWMNEPDFCRWESYGFCCLAIRDMNLGMWRGFVGVTKIHPFFNKNFEEILHEEWLTNLDIHGGLSDIGKLPIKFNEYNDGIWWFSFECTQGEDFLPLIESEKDVIVQYEQSYKDLHFVRRETNYLAKKLFEIQ